MFDWVLNTPLSFFINNNNALLTKFEYLTAFAIALISQMKISQNNSEYRPKKTHDCDQISIRTPKTCSISSCKPLNFIFYHWLVTGTVWLKNTIAVLFHWQGGTQILKKYRPVSLLPVKRFLRSWYLIKSSTSSW